MLEALKARILAKSEAERALEVIEQGTKDRQARLEADAEVAETQRLEALRAELGELRGRLQQLITRQAALLASVQERITALCSLVRELSQINTEGSGLQQQIWRLQQELHEAPLGHGWSTSDWLGQLLQRVQWAAREGMRR